ncbi:MAG: tyrosine-type recombinase/integrase [Clostridiales bacterium]|jgi:site-specific recombinase XerD|nr:tyrosine-type recombinase/integrase [Clostridiales bacterium]
MPNSYHEDQKIKSTIKLRLRLGDLPAFMHDFFRGIADTTSALTRIAYARDIKIFLRFLSEERPEFKGKPCGSMTVSDLSAVTSDAIEEYMEYLSYYTKTDDAQRPLEIQNGERGKARKLSAVRSMFSYFYKRKLIQSNPADLVDLPKIHGKSIIRLEVDEISRLLDEVESGTHLTDRQKRYHEHTKLRDAAIITLMLGTGMRVSECVGINISDIDFNINGVIVTRKGGDESTLYFGGEVEEALKRYLAQRREIQVEGLESDALFLSMRGSRIGVRAVECLVKKYSRLVAPVKKISPHKLRSTYGTRLYQETGDIYLVADVLGHADVNTTKKHYADMDEDRRRKAAKYVKLRKSEDPSD